MRRLWIWSRGYHARDRRGFTLIELLVTIVVLGILASISLKIVGAKRHAYVATMQSDLHNMTTAQEMFYSDNLTYTSLIGDGMGMGCGMGQGLGWMGCPGVTWSPSPGVSVELYGDGAGFSSRMTHTNSAERCAIFSGSPGTVFEPATQDGLLVCDGAGGGGGQGMGPPPMGPPPGMGM